MSRRRKRKPQAPGEALLAGSTTEPEAEAPNELSTSPRRRQLSIFLAWFPLLLLALGNGRNPWVPALAAAVVGGLLVMNPPRNRLPYSFLFLAAAMALSPLLALLPLPAALQADWRQALVNDHGLNLPMTWSAQPWVTWENWCAMMVVLLWFAWGAGHWQTSGDRAPVMRQLALGLSLLAIVSLAFHFLGWQPQSWGVGTEKDIGPYANRNHFSCLMAMNAVLCIATAYDLLRRKNSLWVVFALGLVPSFAAVMVNTSLGGLLIFSAGITAWLAFATLRGKSLQKVAIAGSIVLVLTAGVLLFGQHLLGQMFDSDTSIIEKMTEGARPAVYRDTLALIAQNPVLGVGMGNFAAVFGMTNSMAEGYVRFRHPESDWLWFLAEVGWLATLVLLISLVLFVSWMGLWKASQGSTQRRERRARLAAGLAVLVSIGHGAVDVPNHTLSHALIVALLAGMALHHQPLSAAPGRLLVLPFRLGGILLIGAACLWGATGFGYMTPMGESIWRRDLAQSKAFLRQGEVKAAAEVIEHVIQATPLSWEAYFVRAETSLKLGLPSSQALADFARARALEPNVANYCMIEAQLWLRFDPMMAVPAWREALRREKSEDTTRYDQMLQAAQLHPELRPAVRDLATRARLMLGYLATTQGLEFQDTLNALIGQFPQLEGMTSYQRQRLFYVWRERGNRTELVKALQANDEWLKDGWVVLADELAAQGQRKEAFEVAQRFVVTSMNLTTDPSVKLEQLEREFLFAPSDPQRGFRLYIAQREAKLLDAAVLTLTKMAAQPNAPKHVNFELGRVHALMENYDKAWDFTARYIHG